MDIKDTVIEVHSKKVLLLEQAIEYNILPDPDIADIWVVNHKDQWLTRRFLQSVIRSEDIRIYLKTIFLQKELKQFYGDKSCHLKYLSDGYIKKLAILKRFPLIDFIESFIQKNRNTRNSVDFASENHFLIQKNFDYYYTRSKTIKPFLERKSLTGYAYPRIETYFFNSREAFIISRALLQETYELGYLSRVYEDTNYLCRNCRSGFLNYREICPKCSGHNLKARFLIHHFRCAYVGVETDFMYKDKLICPKCSSGLKNLGVDYDKPSKAYICQNKKCEHTFQEPPIGVSCIDCATEQSPFELVVKKIYEYKITEKGIREGLKGSAGVLG